ncbi:MAG: MASE1 domain-containing protein [Sandaracinus sp.]|nr:MASE1 domain-containing protein [Sandaracinus sp.]MCB9616507.1 MASE1 domain-containing protein [Sandaracinus sp.]MCB9635848.1 MASE1 domain-containing protein [Sandaracinus sp.]
MRSEVQSSARPERSASILPDLARATALVVLYVVSGRIGLALAHEQDNATLFWPPTGLAIAALLLLGPRFAPAIFVGACIVNLSIGTPLVVGLSIGLGNMLEASLGAFLLHRLGVTPAFDTRHHVLTLLGVAFVASGVSAAFGVGALRASDNIPAALVGSVALTWWLGNVGGALVVTPLVLLASHGPETWARLARRPAAWLILGAAALSTGCAFGGLTRNELSLLLTFLPFPFVVWAGLSLGPRGAMLAGVVVAVVSVVGTAKGGGPFAGFEADLRMLVLWAYAATMGTVASILAAAVAERDRAEGERLAAEKAQHDLDVRMRDTQRLEGLGLLASGVAHDFNNILAAVRVNAELLAQTKRPAQDTAMLDEIDHAVSRAADLCRQLLAYAGRAPAPLGPVSLGDVVRDVRRLVASSLPAQVTLEVDVPDDLPAVWGEVSQLQQVVLNLVLNAVEAVGERGRVSVRAGFEGDAIRLEVEDDGPGMDEATRARIFDPFFTTKTTGRGLGLAAVRGIVTTHEGTLEVTSSPGHGTTFRIQLRRTDEALPAPTAPIAREKRRALHVLVLDDDDAIREVVRTALEMEGHRVEGVADGEEAIERAGAHPFDVVLLDLTMPGLGGVEVLRGIRARHPQMPAVLMSGYDESQLPHDEVFLAKPFTLTALHDALARATETTEAPTRGA